MIFEQELIKMKNADIHSINKEELVDINTVKINSDLPKNERILDFINQIKNPYCFKCGNFIVKTRFSDNGVTLEDCLKSILI